MKLHEERLAAQTSLEAGLKERAQVVRRVKKQSQANLLAVLGAPFRRDARGASAWLSWQNQLKESAWFDVLKKVILGVGALALIAYLGHRAESDMRYGPVLFTANEGTQGSRAEANTLLSAAPPSRDEQGVDAAAKVAEPSFVASTTPCQKAGPSVGPAGVTKDGLVILNEATADEMTQLPSVGPARARAIIELRERLGRFKKVSDLLRIRGIGWKTLQKMKDKAILDRPVEAPASDQEPASSVETPPTRNSQAPGAPGDKRMARADTSGKE